MQTNLVFELAQVARQPVRCWCKAKKPRRCYDSVVELREALLVALRALKAVMIQSIAGMYSGATSQLGAWLMSSFFAYLGRRLFASIGVLVSVSILIFVIARVIPGDPAHIALGPMASQESIAN